jgi:hypothetical protein
MKACSTALVGLSEELAREWWLALCWVRRAGGFVLVIGSRCGCGSGVVCCGVFPARRGGVSPWVGGAAPVNSEHGA